MADIDSLVVAPHALDEVLGCGGTATAAIASGRACHSLILFGDGTGRDSERREAANAVADRIGARPPRFAGFEENAGDRLRLGDLVTAIEGAIKDLLPATVYVPSGASLHVDHRRTYEAAMTALRPVPGLPVRQVLAYEIVSSTDWAPPVQWARFTPTRFVDIAPVLEIKRACLDIYRAEMRPPPHARSIEAVIRRAETYGASVGLSATEAFEVIRQIG